MTSTQSTKTASLADIFAAIDARRIVTITYGHLAGASGIALGYSDTYGTVKVGFLAADGSYSGESTRIPPKSLRIAQTA